MPINGKKNKECYKEWEYEPWCRVKSEGKCGYNKGRGKDDMGNSNWDFCEWKGLWKYNKDRKSLLPVKEKFKNVFGLILYLSIFGIIIPLFFKKMGWDELTEVWIPNLDLMATVLSFKNGFFNTRIFSYLYDTSTSTDFEYWSRLIINYISILGVVYISGARIKKTGKVSEGLSFALVMVICTYLIPNDFISETMNYIFYESLWKYKLDRKLKTRLAMISGFIVAIGFILLEKLILNLPGKPNLKIAKYLTSIHILNE